MVSKKKFLGGLKPFFMLLFLIFFVGFSSNCKATTYNDLKLTENDVSNIFTSLGKSSLSSTDIQYITQYYNEWASFYAYTHPNSDVSYLNLVFFYGNQTYSPIRLEWFLSNGSFGNDLDFYYISNLTATSNITPRYWNGWTYNTNTGLINGANVTNISGWEASTSTYSTKTVSVLFQGTISSTDTLYSNNRLLTTTATHAFYGYDSIYGYRPMLNINYIILDGMTTPTVTPTPTEQPSITPTSTPTGGGGSVDLTETNNKIDQVNSSINNQGQAIIDQISGDSQNIINNLTDVPESGDFTDVSSGDILTALDFNEEVDPYENFWASFIDGLNLALTCPNNTTYDIEIFGTNYTIDSADWSIDYPQPLKYILIIACTIGIVFAELKMWRKILISINTGNIFKLAISYSNDDITDLF